MDNEDNKFLDEIDVIRVKMTYDYKTIKSYYRFNNFKSAEPVCFIMLQWLAALIYFAMFLLSLYSGFEEKEVGFLFSIIFFTVSISNTVKFFIQPKKYFNNQLAIKNANVEYIFGKEDFSSIRTTEYASSESRIRYDALWQAYETEEAFYLYDFDSSVHIINKHEVENVKVDDLSRLLESNVKKGKYKLYL